MEPNQQRRRGRFTALAATLPSLTRRVYARRGFAAGAVVRDWAIIVGNHLASRCQPDRIIFPRGKKNEGTLYLRTPSGAEALELQHLAPLILDRINGHFGYKAVIRMKFEPGFRPTVTDTNTTRRRSLAPEEEKRLDSQLADIYDESLKASLKRLGTSVIRKSPPQASS